MATRFVIVGSGIAGLSAAEAIRQREPRASIQMISEESHNFYSRPGLAYLLRGDVPERQLTIRTPDDLRRLHLDRVHALVERISPDTHEVRLTNGRTLAYDRLLVATGALATPPSFPGSDLAGIFKLDSLDDTRRILKWAKKRRTAVVIGGGITALELAEGLAARGLQVNYFLRGPRYWGDVLDEAESRIIQQRLAHEGIVIHVETQVERAIEHRGRIAAVMTKAGTTVPCELLAVAIGVKPRMDLARESGLAVGKGILVNPHLETSASDVYAAGDVAELQDPRNPGASALDVLWPTALEQGRIAGANMAGERLAYRKAIPFNVTQLAGLRVTIIGRVGGGKDDDLVTIGRGDSEVWRIIPRAWVVSSGDDVNRIRLVLGEKTLVGALVMGDQTWSRPLQRLIVERADVTPVLAGLRAGGAEALQHLARFYQQWESESRLPRA